MDASIVIAAALVAMVAVLVRLTMTMADISKSLEQISGEGAELKVKLAARPKPVLAAAPTANAEADDAELAAVIAIAKAALDNSLPINQKG